MVKVKDEVSNEVGVLSMKDGDIAVITKWSYKEPIGRVVKRYKDILISLGLPERQSWDRVLNVSVDEGLRVRILPKGTTLIIE